MLIWHGLMIEYYVGIKSYIYIYIYTYIHTHTYLHSLMSLCTCDYVGPTCMLVGAVPVGADLRE